jgi:hypothetical protein
VGAVLMWIWIAVGVLALVILATAGGRLLGRLGALRRAADRLQQRQAEAMRLQQEAAVLKQSVAALQERIAALRPDRR